MKDFELITKIFEKYKDIMWRFNAKTLEYEFIFNYLIICVSEANFNSIEELEHIIEYNINDYIKHNTIKRLET